MTKRRAIRRDEEASIRAWAAMAIEASSVEVVGFYWNRLGSLRSIAVRSGPESERDITQHEIAALAAVGIHPGADGWEIEEAPANARPPLPPGFGWYEHGHESYGLDRRRPAGEETIAKAHHDGYSWTWSIAPRHVRTTARDLREAQERAEEACRAAGLFDAPTVDRAQAIRDALLGQLTVRPCGFDVLLDTVHFSALPVGASLTFGSDDLRVALVSIGAEPDGNRWRLSDGPPRGWEWHVGALVTSLKSSPVDCLSRVIATVGREDDEPGRRAAALMACRRAGLFAMVEQAPTAPDLGAKVDAAGAPPTGAARTLMTLLLRATSLGEMPGTQPTLAERLDAMEHLCEAFVAELRASLPAAPMPAPRTTDGALTAYLLEHYRDAWRPGEDALALAIRLLDAGRETGAEIGRLAGALEEAQEEAKISDANADELAKTAATLRRERNEARATLALEEARRIEAERGRGEALGDLATVRNDVLKSAHDLAAKMGAPHG